jgi:hypothetical protein
MLLDKIGMFYVLVIGIAVNVYCVIGSLKLDKDEINNDLLNLLMTCLLGNMIKLFSDFETIHFILIVYVSFMLGKIFITLNEFFHKID